MAGAIGTNVVKDGNNVAMVGGVRMFDVSGTGVGPWVPVSLLYDPVSGALATIKPASTAPVATDTAHVVAIHPLSVNANLSDGSGQASAGHIGAPTVPLDPYSQYKVAPTSATTKMGASGAQYDYLAGVLIAPTSTSPGAVSIQDGVNTAIVIFAGGASSVSDLRPFMVSLGLHALSGSSPGWNLIFGASVAGLGVGKFT